MLELDNLLLNDRALKNIDVSRVKRYVVSIIRHEELSKLINRTRFTDSKRIIFESHVNVDPMTCEKNILYPILRGKAELFIKDREEVLKLYKICSGLPTIEEINELAVTDRVHIELLAHLFCKYSILDNKIFDSKQDGIDIQFETITKMANKISRLKDILRPIFYRLVGREGNFFYGIKVRKSDFHDKDIRNFFVSLSGTHDIMRQRKAFTEFCTVFLYGNESDYQIDDKSIQTNQTIHIRLEDLVIRCNVFRCMHKAHHIENVLAMINVIDEDGDIQIKSDCGLL